MTLIVDAVESLASADSDQWPGLKLYPCTGHSILDAPIVLLHGWGADSCIWQGLPESLSEKVDALTLDLPGFGDTPQLVEPSQDDFIQWLARVLPSRCYLVGLSLGGMLATAYSAANPMRVAGLVTISSNLSFVQRDGWCEAMPSPVFEKFVQSWEASAAVCLKRFAGLQAQGDINERQLIRHLRSLDADYEPEAWGRALALLSTLDNRQRVTQLQCPTLAIFGEKDALVPASASVQIAHQNSQIETHVIKGAAHLPHLSCTDEVQALIDDFLENCRYQLDKGKVAESFGRAAKRYDNAAQLQHRIGESLLENIPEEKTQISILDLGCGTGYHSRQLHSRFPDAKVLGADISPGMLSYAAETFPEGEWLCADAENLPIPDASQSLVFSNFALQWCASLNRVCSEIFRVLDNGGELYFAVPGPQTLTELREAWLTVDEHVHVNRFFSPNDWTLALKQAGFQAVSVSSEHLIESHQSVRELLLELKAVGAHNVNSGKQTGMTGKQQLQALYDVYEDYRLADGTIPASWEIIIGKACKL